MSTEAKASTEVQEIPIEQLIPTPENPRIIHTDTPKFRELLDSVKGLGVKVPVMCRPHPTEKGKYDLRAGARRLAAAEVVGLEAVPAIVMELNDAEAFEVTFLENWGREDLTMLEECREVEILLDKYSGDVEAVASKLSWPEAKVRSITRIRDLDEDWKAAMADTNHPVHYLTRGHLELIARLPTEMRQTMLEDSEEYLLSDIWGPPDEVISIDALRERIETELMHALSAAPWALDDPNLVPELGACDGCPKRSDAQGQLGLWGDSERVTEATCLDWQCWARKQDASMARTIAEKMKDHPNLHLLSENYMTDDEQIAFVEDIPDYKLQIFKGWQFAQCKKSDKDAVPCMYIDTPGRGRIIWKKPEHGPGMPNMRRVDPETGETMPKPLADRRRELDSKRWCRVLELLRQRIQDVADLSFFGDSEPAKLRGILNLSVAFGTTHAIIDCWGSHYYLHHLQERGGIEPKAWEMYDEVNQKQELDVAETYLWPTVRAVLSARLAYNGGVTQLPQSYIDEAEAVAGLLNIDVEAIFQEVSESKGFTEPKSWAKLNADGTPKKAKLKAKKSK